MNRHEDATDLKISKKHIQISISYYVSIKNLPLNGIKIAIKIRFKKVRFILKLYISNYKLKHFFKPILKLGRAFIKYLRNNLMLIITKKKFHA